MKIKKIIIIAGRILTVLALILIVSRLFKMDVDYSTLLQSRNIIWIAVLTIVYSFNVAMAPYAWMIILEITTGHKLAFFIVQNISCKSNLLKYLPGNIFQYVGRNEIAVRYDLLHRDVALSTFLDIIANILAVFFVAVICYASGFNIVFHSLERSFNLKISLIILFLIFFVIFIAYKKREVVLAHVKKILTKRNIAKYGVCVAYYMLIAIYTGLIYYFILSHLLYVHLLLDEAFVVVGAYLFSWLVGFLVIGSPGGIGVREAAIVTLLAPYLDSSPVLLAIIIYRIINIVGDVVAYLGSIACVHFCTSLSQK